MKQESNSWKGLSNPERARKMTRVRMARREASRASAVASESKAVVHAGDQASREVIGRILADEVAWRSSLVSLIGELREHLVRAIREKVYNADRTTLSSLAAEARKLIESEEKMIERTRNLDYTPKTQVAGLVARHALLRQQLIRSGLMDPETGELKMPGASKQNRNVVEERNMSTSTKDLEDDTSREDPTS